MRQDLTCPVELRSWERARDDRGRVRVYLKVFNLSTREIREADVILTWRGEQGERGEKKVSFENLNWAARSRQRLSVTLTAGDVQVRAVRFVRLAFAGYEKEWIGRRERFVSYPGTPGIRDARLARRLSVLAGPDAVCFPRRDSDSWLCVCGRRNLNDRPRCVRCRRRRETVFARYQKEKVLEARLPHGAEDAARRPLTQFRQPVSAREKYLRQKKLLWRRTAMLLILLCLLLFALWCANRAAAPRPNTDVIPPVRAVQTAD